MKSRNPYSHLDLKICQLCEQEPTAELSHIIPRLITKALAGIMNGNTFQLRDTANPNVLNQDTLKLPFLGGLCEDKLGNYESHFASEYQDYLKREDGKLEIDATSYRLLVSVCWRVARLLQLTSTPEQKAPLAAPESTWREYLLKDLTGETEFPLYLFSARDFSDEQIKGSHSLSRTHLNSMVGIGVNGFYGNVLIRQCLTIFMGPLILCARLRDLEGAESEEAEAWKKFAIVPGTLIPSEPRSLPIEAVDAIDAQVNWTINKISLMSERQKAKQKEFADKHLKSSNIYNFVLKDQNLFKSPDDKSDPQ